MKVAVVARRLGVAPATLRTWARRYGLGPSAHTAGAHRQYSSADLERLLVMRRLTLEGVAPAEAARIAVATPVPVPAAAGGPRAVWPVAPAIPRQAPDDASGSADPVDAGRTPAGVTALGEVDAAAQASGLRDHLFAAAASLDADRCAELLDGALARSGVVATWEHLVLPVLRSERSRWERGQARTDVTPMLADVVLNCLFRAVRVAGGPPRVLLASAEGEDHSLGLHVAAAAFWEQGTATRVLGPRVPREALAAAARQVGPVTTAVMAVLPVRDPHQLHGLPGVHPPMRVVALGPGWDRTELPRTVHVAPALHHLLADARG